MNLGKSARPRIVPPIVYCFVGSKGGVFFSTRMEPERLEGQASMSSCQVRARKTEKGWIPVHRMDCWSIILEAKARGATLPEVEALMALWGLHLDEIIMAARSLRFKIRAVGANFEASWMKNGIAFLDKTPLEAVGGLIALLMARGEI